MSDFIEVAAAVILQSDGQFLLGKRPVDKVYAGYWEFPGGKIEQGEEPESALKRELFEELGIEVTTAYPWITQTYIYPHGKVRLHFFRITRWHNDPIAREHDGIVWQYPDTIEVTPMLPANALVLKALNLPSLYAISNAQNMGVTPFLKKLESQLQQGLRFLQIREKGMPSSKLKIFLDSVLELTNRYGARITINSDHMGIFPDFKVGLHLTAVQLMQTKKRPDCLLCGASCHNQAELNKAAELELDFVVLGPVLPTISHPEKVALDWEQFSQLATNYALPIYALGGMRRQYMDTAWENGAHGIASMTRVWDNE